jgi:hypothetical protein
MRSGTEIERPTGEQPAALDPRRLSRIAPPPMIVVHKGWWADRMTERPAAELAQEDRDRRERG